MGTSTSQRSPNTPNWQLATAVLGRQDVAVQRQSEEMWRAALADREGRLADELGGDILAGAGAIAGSARGPQEAAALFQRQAREQKSAGLVLDLARRALIRAVAQGAGAAGYAAELFSETASYYASRDLPSYVGAPGRVEGTSSSVALKDGLRNMAREVVQAAGPPPLQPRAWRAFVGEVLTRLSGQGAGS